MSENCKTAAHVCYGYGIKANIDWKASLGDQWRQYERILPVLAASTVDRVSVEFAGSRVPMALLGLLSGKDVLVGCIGVATERVETPEDVAGLLENALQYVPPERLFPCTNCGMVLVQRETARRLERRRAPGARPAPGQLSPDMEAQFVATFTPVDAS